MSWTLRIIRSLFGLIGLTLTVAGVPLLLWHVSGSPVSGWAALFTSNGGLWSTLTTPVIDGTSLLPLLLVSVGWLLWAYYTLAVLLEIAAQVGNLSIHVPGFGLPRVAAGPIVALCLSVVIAAPLVLGATTAAFASPRPDHGVGAPSAGGSAGSAARHGSSAARHNTPDTSSGRATDDDYRSVVHTSTSRSPTSREDQTAAAHNRSDAGAHRSAVHDESVTVQRGDSLWNLAETYYGDGMQWHKIATANADLVGDKGQHLLEPGWQLTIPDVVHRDHARPGETYEVRQGDNLSKIADAAYGDSHEWRQIYDANHDQIDNPDQIMVGQDLTLPPVAGGRTQTRHASQGPHQRGSDLVDAGRQHPDHREHPEHSTGHTDHSTSPGADHDRSTDRGSEPQAPSAAPTIDASSAQPSASSPAQPHPSESTQPKQEAPTGHATHMTHDGADANPEHVSPVVWAAPASALLAAGVLSLVVARRRSHQMRRAAGRRIRPFSDDASAAVTALRDVASDLTVAHLDRATRTLSARLAERGDCLPIVTVARLADDRMDLLLGEPAGEPPPPFTATTPTVWTLHAVDADELLDARDASEIAAPWPALVTVGRDADGAHLLIDLETIASLAIHADKPADVPGLLAAMAIELTTSTWADDLTLTLVACCEELADASGVDRVRYVDDVSELIGQLEGEARQSRQLLVDEELSAARQGRLDSETADCWTPHVVLIGSPLDEQASSRLQAILSESPRVAIAAVTSGASDQLTEWSLTAPPITPAAIRPDESGESRQTDFDQAGSVQTGSVQTGSVRTDAVGRLEPLGLQVSPQYVDTASYRAILQVLRESQTAADEPAPWWNHDADADPVRYNSVHYADQDAAYADADALVVDPADTDPATFDGPALAGPEITETTTDDTNRSQAPTILTLPVSSTEPDEHPDENSATISAASPISADRTEETTPDTDGDELSDGYESRIGETIPLHRPTVRLLGPVDILNVTGTLTAKRSPTELYEPIAWVLLHPDGLTTQFKEAMRHTSDSNALASRARRYLGLASDGQQLFPAARRTEAGRIYRLHDEVESDWGLFCELIDGGANTAPTRNLIQALSLVRGKPLESVTPWAWADEWVETATAAIVDTAHVLAQRSLAANKIKVARAAVRRGRLVDDLVELLIRDEIRIERAAHNFGRVERLCNQLVTNARQHNMELSPESLTLLNEIRTLTRRRAASNS